MDIEKIYSLDIDKILDVVEFEDCRLNFREASDIELKNGNKEKAKILSLLGDISSLSLKPDNWNEPFAPFYTCGSSRSAIVEDFSDDDLKIFSDIADKVNDYRLKSRIADVLWIRKKNKIYLKLAIESYINIPFRFHPFELNCYKRAIKLSVNTKQKQYLNEIRQKLLDKFYSCTIDDKRYCADIASLLDLLKVNPEISKQIANKLEEFAKIYQERKDFPLSLMYYDEAKKWYKKIKNSDEKILQLTIDKAELFCIEASNSNGSMTRKYCLENALQELKTIPKKNRAEFDVGGKIDKIYYEISLCNSDVKDELQLIQTDPVDISEYQKESVNLVKDKHIEEAIVVFANITPLQSYSDNENIAEKLIRKFPLSSLVGKIYIADDGRKIAKASMQSEHLSAEIYRLYNIGIGLSLDGAIMPAFNTILKEHRISKEFIFDICSNSAIVPRNRVNLWTSGIFYGFERDFMVSSHLLIPQLENLVRVLLKQKDINTTIIDENGIQTEKSINSLLDIDELLSIFPKNLVEELKFLLTSPIGFNHRNNVLHGLLDDNKFTSYADIYIWWLCLRLVVNNGHLRIAWDNNIR